jgi:hypothetical protein
MRIEIQFGAFIAGILMVKDKYLRLMQPVTI